MITGLPKEKQQERLIELAAEYGVDLTKIMGINVAFDIIDNTDDKEPTRAKMAPPSSQKKTKTKPKSPEKRLVTINEIPLEKKNEA